MHHSPENDWEELPDVGFFYDRNDAGLLYKIGLQLQLQNRKQDSGQFLERASSLDPENVAIRNSLGNLYLALQRWDKAEEHLEMGLRIDPHHKELLSNRGLVYKAKGRYREAEDAFRAALDVDPDFMHARDHLDFLYKDVVPSWHFSMMHDALRNEAYDRAIRNVVTPDSLVFEIGTGAGLLAMMAARAGAKEVITTEMIPSIAETAKEVIATNGYSDPITVLSKKSWDVIVGEDIPRKADVLITETFDAGFLGEEAAPSIQHARDVLLEPDAKIIPRAGTVFGAFLESRKLWEECAVDEAAGFDLRPFNRFRENISGKYVQNFPHRRLSNDFEIFHFDFTGEPIQNEHKEIEVEVTREGTFHMLIYWFRLYLDEEVVINTNIEDESCWRIAVQTIDPPMKVAERDKILVIAQHNRRWMKLRLGERKT